MDNIKELFLYKIPRGVFISRSEFYSHFIKLYDPLQIGGVCYTEYLFLTIKLDPKLQMMKFDGIRPIWLKHIKTIKIEKKLNKRFRNLLVDIFPSGKRVARYCEEEILNELAK